MRVEATSASYLYTASLRATERVQKITANAAQAASAPQAVEDAPRAETAKPVDFSRMTWGEMDKWINEQYKQGKISGEECTELSLMMFLSGAVRYNGASGRLEFPKGDEVFDFMQIARDGVATAREHLACGNQEIGQRYLDLFGTALSVMERFQGRQMSVDVFA